MPRPVTGAGDPPTSDVWGDRVGLPGRTVLSAFSGRVGGPNLTTRRRRGWARGPAGLGADQISPPPPEGVGSPPRRVGVQLRELPCPALEALCPPGCSRVVRRSGGERGVERGARRRRLGGAVAGGAELRRTQRRRTRHERRHLRREERQLARVLVRGALAAALRLDGLVQRHKVELVRVPLPVHLGHHVLIVVIPAGHVPTYFRSAKNEQTSTQNIRTR